jgi:hypothetical protein
MDSWRRDLQTLPERAEKAIKPVMSRAGVQIKLDWKRRWTEAGSPTVGHIPHLIRSLGYDLSQKGTLFAVTVGVASNRPQSRLASFIEYGTLTSAPHPAGQESLDAEVPKFLAAMSKVAHDLLEESS